MTDNMENKLYCNQKLKIREYISKSKSLNIRSNVNEVFVASKRFCVLIDESQNIDNIDDLYSGSYVTDLFEIQSRLSYEMFIRSTAKLKKNINTDKYFVDKNILRSKITQNRTNIISIAIHYIDKIKRNKVIDLHQNLYRILTK